MRDYFSEIDFDRIYPSPTAEVMSWAYFNRLYRKLHVENFSLLITFYGRHRTGKSLSAADFGHILDPTFLPNLEKRVVYTSQALLQAFRDIRQKRIKGGAVIVDEAGTGDLSNQRWYEQVAKIVSAELQAVGYLNPFIGFVTQSFSFINTTARKLSQGVFEVNRTNNEYCTIKPFWIENNPWVSGFYRKYPIFCENHAGVASNIYKINCIKMGIAPSELLERYIAHSQAYKDKLLVDSEEEINLVEFDKTSKKAYVSGIDAIVEEVVTNYYDYTSLSQKKGTVTFLNPDLIRHAHEALSVKDSKLVKALAEKRLNKQALPQIIEEADA
jgi:hypothetical protein